MTTTPLIDERLFHAAHAAMQRRAVPRRSRIEGFMLKGLITCAHCARPLTASESRGKHGDRHAYYHCQPRTKGPRCHRVRRDALDTAFLDALDACTVDDEALRRRCAQLERFIAQQAAEQAAERKQLEARKGKIDADRMRLVGHVQSGTLAPDIYAKARGCWLCG